MNTPWFGRALVERFLPHRPPLLLVDRVLSVELGARPSLRARLDLDPAAPVYAGHFPSRPLWPGVYTFEGLAQAGGLLLALELAAARAGPDLFDLLRDGSPLPLPAAVGFVLLVEIDGRLLAPVSPGGSLEYAVRVLERAGGLVRFEGGASAAGQDVARATWRVVAPTAPRA